MRVLDYGCGDGGFRNHLEKPVPTESLFGFDRSEELLSETTFRGATTLQKTKELLDRHAHSFDVVLCMEVCERLMLAEIFEQFEKIRNLAEPNAKIVFSDPIKTVPIGFERNIYKTVTGHR